MPLAASTGAIHSHASGQAAAGKHARVRLSAADAMLIMRDMTLVGIVPPTLDYVRESAAKCMVKRRLARRAY